MNYASLIALLAALAFSLPFFVKLAQRAGIPRGFSMVTTLAIGIFMLSWFLVRDRIKRRESLQAQIGIIQDQIHKNPNDPTAYYLSEKHLGNLLLACGNKVAAFEAFITYKELAQTNESDLSKVTSIIKKLKRELYGEFLEE